MLGRELVYAAAPVCQLAPCDLGVDLVRDFYKLFGDQTAVFHKIKRGKRLYREGHIHYFRGVAVARADVYKPALRNDINAFSVRELIALYVGAGIP